MNKNVRKCQLELARDLSTLKKISPDLSDVNVEIPYQGITFTIAKATLTLPRSGRSLIGEGVSRRSFTDRPNGDTGFNVAVHRALEALDKKLRRTDGFVGHRFEG